MFSEWYSIDESAFYPQDSMSIEGFEHFVLWTRSHPWQTQSHVDSLTFTQFVYRKTHLTFYTPANTKGWLFTSFFFSFLLTHRSELHCTFSQKCLSGPKHWKYNSGYAAFEDSKGPNILQVKSKNKLVWQQFVWSSKQFTKENLCGVVFVWLVCQ